MSAIQLAGLASGFDWTTLISSIITADRVPEIAMQKEQTTNSSKLSAFTSLTAQLTDLKTSLTALQDPTLFTKHGTSVSNTAMGWTATAGAGTPNNQYTVAVTQLAAAASRQGASNVGRGLSATASVSGVSLATMPTATAVTAGNFQVNGATVAVALSDSLQDVFAKISAATSGGVTASYDPATDKITLQTGDGSPVVLGASNDTSNFLSALKLSNSGASSATSAGALGATQLYKPLGQSHLLGGVSNADASGNGSFQINGVAISYNVNTDSLQSVMNTINASSAGVTAAFDSSNDRFTLTNSTTGDLGMSVSETGAGLLGAMGLTSASGATVLGGKDAHYSVNGGSDTVSHSNTLTDPSGLSVGATTLGSQTITVSSDSTAGATAINNFIAKYNAIQSAIAQQTKITVGADKKVTSALFGGNHDMSDISRNLRQLAFAAVPGLNGGTAQRLQSIGIDFVPGTSTLAVKDSAALATALATNGASVANLFQNSASGLTTQLNKFIATTTGTGGIITAQTAALNKRNATITQQISALERRLTAEQTALTTSFTQMEQIQASIKAQGQTLTNAFSTTSTSSA